ncbi:hypothetical protein F0562_010497 [Nyssa sinensis]|uniref:Uncharacterized protein n=1 Tax=Nyssa sinensis TaxID=561372 RepID=A0A5J5A2S1_9ASTE|nr:hypothetical protein F0562_010497 [Nyssa sinensis]
MVSEVAFASARYSASDLATALGFFELQNIGVDPRKLMYTKVEDSETATLGREFKVAEVPEEDAVMTGAPSRRTSAGDETSVVDGGT